MKSISLLSAPFVLLGLLTIFTTSVPAQVIAPEKSAREAAISDTRFIATSIEDNEDAMFLSQKAIDRAADARVKELARQMLEDHTGMLYAMEQLKAAGGGSSNPGTSGTNNEQSQVAVVNEKLSGVSGADFDTIWVSSLLNMQQGKYDELSGAKGTVTNPQLKMAITEAIPLIRKHLSQLRSLQKYLTKMAIQKKKQAAKQEGK